MSRMALALIALIASAPAARAQDAPVRAEQALDHYREMTAAPPDCPRNPFDSDEILVCGKDESAKQRLPLPAERGPRDGPRRATGEAPRASAAAIGGPSCGVLQNGRSCGGGLNVMAGAALLVKGIIKVIDPEAEVTPEKPLPKATLIRDH